MEDTRPFGGPFKSEGKSPWLSQGIALTDCELEKEERV